MNYNYALIKSKINYRYKPKTTTKSFIHDLQGLGPPLPV